MRLRLYRDQTSSWSDLTRFEVRKLTGKAVADTTPDCEFKTRTIHSGCETSLSFLGVASNAW